MSSLAAASAAMGAAASAVEAAAFRSAEAVGVGVDDVQNPHVVVIWRDTGAVYEAVSPGMRLASAEVQADAVRVARFMARCSWEAQRRGATLEPLDL
ncbi:hypothetical protein MYFR107205_26465 [Mycolicibacterium frederiksbergense]